MYVPGTSTRHRSYALVLIHTAVRANKQKYTYDIAVRSGSIHYKFV